MVEFLKINPIKVIYYCNINKNYTNCDLICVCVFNLIKYCTLKRVHKSIIMFSLNCLIVNHKPES